MAIDERRGDQYGWAVDYETAAAARGRALQECGSGCSVVLTFGRCAAYAADQDADRLGGIVRFGGRRAAGRGLSVVRIARGGARCTVRVWGCKRPGGAKRVGGLVKALVQPVSGGARGV